MVIIRIAPSSTTPKCKLAKYMIAFARLLSTVVVVMVIVAVIQFN